MPSIYVDSWYKEYNGEFMIIHSLNGKILCDTPHRTLRGTIEYCAEKNVSLEGANLRRAQLAQANLDGLIAPEACFWGAVLDGADIGYADLSGADLRAASLKDACLCGSDLRRADLRGAYFSGTLLEDMMMEGIVASCPSLFSCDLRPAILGKGFTYLHRGEAEITIRDCPIVIDGPDGRVVIAGDKMLEGTGLYTLCDLSENMKKALCALRAAIRRNDPRTLLKTRKTLSSR